MTVAESAKFEKTPPRAALTTAPGLGALAVVRVTGSGVGKLLDRQFRPVSASAWRALREGATADDLRRICFGRWPLGIGAGTEELVLRRASPAGPGTEEAWELICHGGPAVAAALLKTLAADGVEIVPPTHPAAAIVPLADALVRHAYLDLPAARTEATASRLLAQMNGALSRAVADLETRFAAAAGMNFAGGNSHAESAADGRRGTAGNSHADRAETCDSESAAAAREIPARGKAASPSPAEERAPHENSHVEPPAAENSHDMPAQVGPPESAGVRNRRAARADAEGSDTRRMDDAPAGKVIEEMRHGPLAAATEELAALAASYAVGRRLLEPARIVLAGEPNVGKSSLLNALLGRPRAIVSPQAGTTRDAVTESAAFEGWPVELCDTAGLRTAADPLEAAGIALTRERLEGADLIVWIFDATAPPMVLPAGATAPGVRIVWNKCDLAAPPAEPAGTAVSAATGSGIDGLIRRLAADVAPCPPGLAAPLPWRPEHAAALETALSYARAGNPAGAADVLRRLREEGASDESV